MKPVESSNISHIGYEDGKLSIRFHSGVTWDYHDVPAEMHEKLMSADSHGSFFAKNIRGKFVEKKQEPCK